MTSDFVCRILLFSAAPYALLKVLDQPDFDVCDVVQSAQLLPARIARMQPHVVVLSAPPQALSLEKLRTPPRIVACFQPPFPVDAASARNVPQAVRDVMRAPMSVLAAPTLKERLDIAQSLLDAMAMPDALRGRAAIALGAAWLSAFPLPAPPVQHWLYPLLAQAQGVSPAAIERRIRCAIESTWLHGNLQAQSALFGLSISAERGKPTNTELLFRLSACIAERLPR